MSVLTHDEILKAVESGDIKITPYNEANLGCASYDLTLSNEFRWFRPHNGVVNMHETTDFKDYTEKVIIGEGESFLLSPQQACLGITVEEIHLADNLCGLLEGRSRFARLGLFVHITAGFMMPGIKNRQVLEIYNASNNTVALHPGTKMCQFIFLEAKGRATYTGRFKAQEL